MLTAFPTAVDRGERVELERVVGALVDTVCGALCEAARVGGFLQVLPNETVQWGRVSLALPGLLPIPPP